MYPFTYMSLIFSPVMLVSSKMTLVVFQMMTRNICLVKKNETMISFFVSYKKW